MALLACSLDTRNLRETQSALCDAFRIPKTITDLAMWVHITLYHRFIDAAVPGDSVIAIVKKECVVAETGGAETITADDGVIGAANTVVDIGSVAAIAKINVSAATKAKHLTSYVRSRKGRGVSVSVSIFQIMKWKF
jgi:hypothetical protein